MILLAGGTIPEADARGLLASGTVDHVFTPGAPLAGIVETLRESVAARRAEA